MIIGIITRKGLSDENHNINYLYNDIVNIIVKYKAIPIGIVLNDNYKTMLNLCDGIIFQGGDSDEKLDYEVLKYLYEINKPTLGICLGMQEMGLLFDGKLGKIVNHKKKLSYAHSISIKKNSRLYSIFNKNIIKVNSRHNDCLLKTNLDIVAISNDNVIEAIEDKSKKFFIGVQWHPESMIEYDSLQSKIFEKFINSCK